MDIPRLRIGHAGGSGLGNFRSGGFLNPGWVVNSSPSMSTQLPRDTFDGIKLPSDTMSSPSTSPACKHARETSKKDFLNSAVAPFPHTH